MPGYDNRVRLVHGPDTKNDCQPAAGFGIKYGCQTQATNK